MNKKALNALFNKLFRVYKIELNSIMNTEDDFTMTVRDKKTGEVEVVQVCNDDYIVDELGKLEEVKQFCEKYECESGDVTNMLLKMVIETIQNEHVRINSDGFNTVLMPPAALDGSQSVAEILDLQAMFNEEVSIDGINYYCDMWIEYGRYVLTTLDNGPDRHQAIATFYKMMKRQNWKKRKHLYYC